MTIVTYQIGRNTYNVVDSKPTPFIRAIQDGSYRDWTDADVTANAYGIRNYSPNPGQLRHYGIETEWPEAQAELTQRLSDIGRETPVTREAVHCDCGHTVASEAAMNASRGSSCPECYDGMSD